MYMQATLPDFASQWEKTVYYPQIKSRPGDRIMPIDPSLPAADTQWVNTDLAPPPVGPYPHARKVGPLLFLSGVGPRKAGQSEIPGVSLDADGNILDYDIATQCHSVFKNVRVILEAAGARWEDLVDVTVFLTHMQADFKTFNAIYREYFPDAATQPCRTTVEVNALPTPIAIELKCVAVIP
jgi:2-aminomuconate deaminase